MASFRSTIRTHSTAVRAVLVSTVILGLIYPAVLLLAGLAMPVQAGGSLVRAADGEVIGSTLIAQGFADSSGAPLPQYFQPRPSASDYDAMASGGTNYGPENEDLIADIQARKAAGATTPDALTASGSGLDPDITVENALSQVDRVAAARHLDPAQVRAIVESKIQPRDIGFLGEPRVNVLELNLALDGV